jgi:hypothetical protein
MAESTLSLGYPELIAEIGYALGYGATSASWDTGQAAIVERVLQAGYRQFLFPPALPEDQGVAHRWSFLFTPLTITTAAADYDYDLADEYAGMEGELTYNPGEGFRPVKIVGEQRIRELRANESTAVTGTPQLAAIRPKTSTGSAGQRFEVLFWPVPDGIYHLTGKEHVLVGKLTTTLPYPLGGMAHAETVKRSCVAEAEMVTERAHGPAWAAFIDRLRTSVFQDRSQSPRNLGQNIDSSDGQGLPGDYDRVTYVTVGGVLPT